MINFRIKTAILFLFMFSFISFYAQEAESKMDSIEEMFFVDISYAPQLPFLDMKEQFGFNSTVGLAFNFKSHKNWTYGLGWRYLFGGDVKNELEIFSNIATSQGYFLDHNGDFTGVKIQERGHLVMGNVGKILPVFGSNQNSGLHVKLGAGFMTHKIKTSVQFDNVPQLAGEYKKLYDRLSSGIALSQFIGYSHFGNSRLVNFYAGIEIVEGFTKGRRDYQADLMAPYTDSRLDILVGFKVGWMIPFRRRQVSEYYFF